MNPAVCPHRSLRKVNFGTICDDCGLICINEEFRREINRAVVQKTQPPCPKCGIALTPVGGRDGAFACGRCRCEIEYRADIEKVAAAIWDPTFRRQIFYALTDCSRQFGMCPHCGQEKLARFAELTVKCVNCGLMIRRPPDDDDLAFEFFFLKK